MSRTTKKFMLGKRKGYTFKAVGGVAKKKRSAATAYPTPRRGVVEKKVYDIDTATYQVNTTGVFTPLCIPVKGPDFTERIGRKIVMKSLYIRGFVRMEETGSMAAGVTAASMQGRMIVFIDLQPTPATALTVTDLLKEALPSSQLNLNNRDRFKILADETFEFDPVVTNATVTTFSAWGKTICPLKKYIVLNEEVIFNATNGGTVADINSGTLYHFWIGSQAAGTNTDINAVISSRVRYTDS